MTRARVSAIVIAAVVMASLASQVVAAPIVLFADDFESYTSGERLPTTGPWDSVTSGTTYSANRLLSVRDSNNVYPGDGSRVVPVSPFGGGTQMLEFWKQAGTSLQLDATVSLAPLQEQYPMTVSLDYRVDEDWSDFNSAITLQVRDTTVSAGGYYISLVRPDTDDPNNLLFGFTRSNGTFGTVMSLSRGTWYHIEFTFDAPTNSAGQPATVKFWQWDDDVDEPNFLGTFDITSRQRLTQIDQLNISGISPANTRGHMYVDNIVVSVVPEPGTLLLIGSGLAGLYGIRRRRQV